MSTAIMAELAWPYCLLKSLPIQLFCYGSLTFTLGDALFMFLTNDFKMATTLTLNGTGNPGWEFMLVIQPSIVVMLFS